MKNKKLIIALSFVTIVTIILVLLFNADKDNYVAKIDGYKVPKEEYYVYLMEQKMFFESVGGEDIWETSFDGQPAETQAKQNALKQIELVKAVNKKADDMGVSLNDEEKKAAEEEALKLLEEMPITYMEATKNSQDIITNTLEEIEILNKVYQESTKNFVLSESDFDAYFEQYLIDRKDEIVQIKGSYIFIKNPDEDGNDTIDKATEAQKKAAEGEDFHSLVRKYSDDYTNNESIVLENIAQSTLPPQVIETAYTLKEGEVSRILTESNGYYIVKAEEIVAPDMNSLEEEVKEDYIKQKKDEIFYKELEKLEIDEPKAEINEEIWNDISISQLN